MRATRRANYDALILGGGPAGSTAGNLLAQLGWRVLVLEKDRFPRHHIGESLLPALNYLFRRLGVEERLKREKFFIKTGGTYVWGKTRKRWSIPFVPRREAFRAMGPDEIYAYHVERDRFDALLLDQCARQGAEVLQNATVTSVRMKGDSVSSVAFRIGGGPPRQATATCYLDASGQSSLLATRLGWKRHDPQLRNMAVYAYFKGAKLLPQPSTNHIFIVNIKDGWIWFIPQTRGRVSVGVVTSVDLAGELRRGSEEFFSSRVAQAPEIQKLLREAKRVEEFRIVRDWSYRSERFSGRNFMLLGDAGAFIDPLLSYGVTLAMHSASLAADCADIWLRMPRRRAEVLDHYDKVHGERFDELLEFVKYFYNANRERNDYFWKARNIADYLGNRYARYAFTYLISGYPLWNEIPFDTKKYLGFFFENLDIPVGRLRKNRRFLDSVSRLHSLDLTNMDQPFPTPAGSPTIWQEKGQTLRYKGA